MLRDAHRLRERVVLSLDDRQIAALAVGALLLLAGMFALGLLVGMQVARRSAQPAPMGDLAALDEQRAQAIRAAAVKADTRPPPAVVAQQVPAEAHDVTPPTPTAVRVDPAPKKEVPAPPPAMTVAQADADDVPAPPRNVGKYTVQLAASQSRTDALQLASRASATGQKVYIVEAKLPGKGVWYRVRVGAFRDKPAAERFRRDIERELRTDAVVMPAQ
jgi:cell division septation protein DedD